MKKLSLFFITLAITVYAADKVYLVGTVFDENSGEPISYVNIEMRSGKKIAKSNSRGRFEVELPTTKVVLVFKRHAYRSVEIDVSELEELIDVEVGMEPAVKELKSKTIRGIRSGKTRRANRQTVDELEQFQGMQIDLNNLVRQLDGVSGMREYDSDISVYGSRTQDVTHYLGGVRIPNLRHLDFGFPGNQSVLNPRLLKSVSVEDNLNKGPANQGNASALKYDLIEGDPEYIRGDLVVGTVNREVNLSFYWDTVTVLASYRRLQPNLLANLGINFFTTSKEERMGACKSTQKGDCERFENPIDVRSEDAMVSIFKRLGNGGYWRHSFLFMSDDFTVFEDVGDWAVPEVIERQDGDKMGILLSSERLLPFKTGDLEFSLSAFWDTHNNLSRDTSTASYSFYRDDSEDENTMDSSEIKIFTYGANMFWSPVKKWLGSRASIGIELNLIQAQANNKVYALEFVDGKEDNSSEKYPDLFSQTTNGTLRMGWPLSGSSEIQSSAGIHLQGLSGVYPMASTRYIQQWRNQTLFLDASIRQFTRPTSVKKDTLELRTTSSAGIKFGISGNLLPSVSYAYSLYSRYYLEPMLPEPEAYWNYKELKKADYAAVFGTSIRMSWEPSHHFSVNINASHIQGDYYFDDGNALPWEANRSLDLVGHLRLVPRKDSLLSVIISYTASNDAPLYEYRLGAQYANNYFIDNGERSIGRSTEFETASRQRLDARINLDLASKWKPLESVRFFFQGCNLFADFDNEYLNWLGGKNRKQRGWTRLSRTRANNLQKDKDNRPIYYLTPDLVRGLGFFILLGFELKIYF